VASSFCRTGRCTSTIQSWGNVWTTELSETAQAVADDLKIQVDKIELDKNYPMIKCNVNKVNSEKIYHLPIDQQYDKILIVDELGFVDLPQLVVPLFKLVFPPSRAV